MAITINGTGTITGLTAGGLPDGSITTDDIAANAVTAAKLATGARGKLLQIQTAHSSTGQVITSFVDLLTVSLTTVDSSANSNIIILGTLAHGLGPASTNLDPYGMSLYLRENGSVMCKQIIDVFAGSGAGVSYGPEYDIRTTSINSTSGATWSAGATMSYVMRVTPDNTNYINRATASTLSNGTSSLIVMEVAK